MQLEKDINASGQTTVRIKASTQRGTQPLCCCACAAGCLELQRLRVRVRARIPGEFGEASLEKTLVDDDDDQHRNPIATPARKI
jgi:hypothetical protein